MGGGGGGVGEGTGVGVGVGEGIGVGVWVGVGDGDSMGVETMLKTFSDSFSEITQIVPGIAIKRSKRKKYFKKDFTAPIIALEAGEKIFAEIRRVQSLERDFFLAFLGFGKTEAIFTPVTIRILLRNRAG